VEHHAFKDKTSRVFVDQAGAVPISLNFEAVK
jgi:hypothetical protein